MKKILLLLSIGMFTLNLTFAQDGEKMLKEASKNVSEYAKNPLANASALESAVSYLEEAFADEAVTSNPKSWLTRGELMYNVAEAQLNNLLLNPDFQITYGMAAADCVNAYGKGLEMSTKKGDKKNALKGLREAQEMCNNLGVQLYQTEAYEGSYANFKAELNAHEILKANGEDSRLDDADMYSEKLYFTGITAFYNQDHQSTIDYLTKAKDSGREEPAIYQLIFEAYNSLEKPDEGLALLRVGREKFPDDSGLLFSEINYYLVKGELSAMIENLEQALAQEPENMSVILTLGQVYDQLQVKSFQEGDADKAQEYFDGAYKYYQRALELDPNNFDLYYSLGALYYNKAANMTPALNEVANDFSPEGTKKYEALKNEMAGYFEEALPFFLKADELDGQDRNTLIALKEIFARKDDFEKSNAYKDRLESLPE
jgi:tetratricopeptide (TPR) repeat protein